MPSRMRARTAPTPEERELNRQLVLAEQALVRSAQLCKAMSKQDQKNHKVLMASKKIQEAVNSIGEVGRMTSTLDASDTDLMSELELSTLSRDRRNARLEKLKEARHRRAERVKQKAAEQRAGE